MRAALTRFLAEYRYGDVEVSRRNLNAGFLRYHSKRLRIYVIRHYLQKREYRTRGLCTVNIETTAYCNRKCSFCFYADRFPKREQGIMKEEVYKKVIDDLAAYGFRGRLSPHSYGEPLLDKRLPSLMEYTRKKLPWCTLDVRTNGDYLTEDLLLTLLNKGVDSFLITNYDDDGKASAGGTCSEISFSHNPAQLQGFWKSRQGRCDLRKRRVPGQGVRTAIRCVGCELEGQRGALLSGLLPRSLFWERDGEERARNLERPGTGRVSKTAPWWESRGFEDLQPLR